MEFGRAEILVCECSSREHQIVIEYEPEDNLVYCSIHLTNNGFFSRFKTAIKYLFGYKCRYGHWDEFIFRVNHADKLEEIAKILKSEKCSEKM